MRQIPLGRHGHVALVDDADYERLARYTWYMRVNKGAHTAYAVRTTWSSTGPRHSIYMHREVVGAPRRSLVDHRDGNGLNNQRGNLRIATISQNTSNTMRRKNRPLLKGVEFRADMKKPWIASLSLGNKTTYLGCFATQEEAAHAYDVAATARSGEFAVTNRILGLI